MLKARKDTEANYLLRQAARPQAIVDLIRSAETMRVDRSAASEQPLAGTCGRCGYITSQACTHLQPDLCRRCTVQPCTGTSLRAVATRYGRV